MNEWCHSYSGMQQSPNFAAARIFSKTNDCKIRLYTSSIIVWLHNSLKLWNVFWILFKSCDFNYG